MTELKMNSSQALADENGLSASCVLRLWHGTSAQRRLQGVSDLSEETTGCCTWFISQRGMNHMAF